MTLLDACPVRQLAVAGALLACVMGALGCARRDEFNVAQPIIGLAVDGDRIAWATEEERGVCSTRLFLRRGGRVAQLRLPRRVAAGCFTRAQLALAATNVGWVFVNQGGNTSEFSAGASSL